MYIYLPLIFIRNLSSPIQKRVGNTTNSAAETQGAAKAIQIANRLNIRHLLIITDSLMLVNFHDQIAQWKCNGWKKAYVWDGYNHVPTTDGEPIQNKEDFLSLE